MRLGFDRRLGELERHPVALADGQILGAILLSQAQGWGRFRTGWFRWSFGFALISEVPISLKPGLLR